MKLNPYNIFVDTNVLIGAFTTNQTDKRCLEYLYTLKGRRLFLSALSIAQLASLFQKRKSNEEIKSIIRSILAKFNIIEFARKDIDASLMYEYSDMEDNIQYVISRKMKCAYFITNNRKDFLSFNLSILLPRQIRSINQ